MTKVFSLVLTWALAVAAFGYGVEGAANVLAGLTWFVFCLTILGLGACILGNVKPELPKESRSHRVASVVTGVAIIGLMLWHGWFATAVA